MNPKPQSLTSLRGLILLAILAGAFITGRYSPFAFAQQAATSNDRSASKPASVASEKTPAEVFAAVEQKLDEATSVQCRLQQTITLSGQRYLAAGLFQQGSGNRMRLQYDIYPVRQLSTEDKPVFEAGGTPENTAKLEATGSLTQVSDGSVLWTYWVNGKEKSLTRRNLQEIQEAAAKVPNKDGLLNLQSLSVGGIKALMAKLQGAMEFGTVMQQKASGAAFFVLAGRWDENTRTRIFKLPADKPAVLPAYIPDYVRVYVDSVSMMPRRIQYLKKHSNPELKRVRPLMTIDFREMKLNADLPAETFVFERPSSRDDEELDEVDVTGQVILGLEQLAGAKAESEPSSAGTDESTKDDSSDSPE